MRRGMTNPPFDTSKIIAEVAAKHGMTVDVMLANKNGRSPHHVSRARMEAAYRLRTDGNLSFPAIGKIIGLDHTTIIHSVRKVHMHLKQGGEWLPIAPKDRKARARAKKAKPKTPYKKVIRAYHTESARAARINALWRESGIDAKARVERDGDQFVIRSSLLMVAA